MPQRNGKNPIRQARAFGQSINKAGGPAAHRDLNAAVAGYCPYCKAEVPPKPGFRFSSLKCPKCGKAMG
jgi:hypothetical protein